MPVLNFPANPTNNQVYSANGKTWIYSTDAGAWLSSTNLTVQSVAGKTGNVTLEIADVTGLVTSLSLKAPLASPDLTGVPTAPTATAGTNTTQIATTAYVRTEVANLVASAPSTLDTLNELATALGNDPNFATTTATALANRLRIDVGNQGLTSTQQGYGRTNLGLATTDAVTFGSVAASTFTGALSGNASTATTLQTARSINGVSFNGSADITVTAAAGTLSGNTLASGVTASSLTSVGTLTSGAIGSGFTAIPNSALANSSITVNGISIALGASGTVTAAAGTLTGSTLASGVTASSLTSVGTLTSLVVNGITTLANRIGWNASADLTGASQIGRQASTGLTIWPVTGTVYDFILYAADGGAVNPTVMSVPTGTGNAVFGGLVGLGVTPDTWGGKVLQFANGIGIGTRTANGAAMMTQNAILDGSDIWKYKAAAAATAYQQTGGVHYWAVAASGSAGATISGFGSAAMVLDASGNLGVGETSPSSAIHAKRTSGAAISKAQTTDTASYASLDAAANSGSGTLYRFGSTYSTSNQYIASSTLLESSTGSLNLSAAAAASIQFWTNNASTPRLVVDSTGRVGVGTASPSYPLHILGTIGVSGVSGGLRYILTDATDTYTGGLALQAGAGSSGYGGAVVMYGHSHAANPGGVLIGRSNASTGSILFGGQGIDNAQIQMTLNSSGNLGLGVTPSAWTLGRVLQVGGVSAFWDYSGSTYLTNNRAFVGGNKYIANGYATSYEQDSGAHKWLTAPSGTAGAAISFTQALTLDASGNLGVGLSSPGARLHLRTQTNGNLMFQNSVYVTGGVLLNAVNDASSASVPLDLQASAIQFAISGTERARITAGGYFKASNAGTYIGATDSYHEFRGGTANGYTCIVSSTVSSPASQYVFDLRFSAATPNDTNARFWSCTDATAERGYLYSNGGLANYSANNVNLASDQRLKKDISPLGATWDKLKALEVVNFRYKDCNDGDPALYGVIAQQVQPIVPELVVVTREATATEPEYYGIREQPMYWLAIKALQEAMSRIETLEAEVAALKA